MHNIYTTDGFILKSINFGEANKYFFIFTKDFGLLKATAQGVRHLKSKLRYSLEDFSFSKISLVRGREVWRITSAEKKQNIKAPEKALILSQIFSLLLRLLQGEEKNDLLFSYLESGVNFLENNHLNKKDLSNFECVMALRILSTLGYVGKLTEFESFMTSPYFTFEILSTMDFLKTKAIQEINKSLKETHL